MEKILVFGHKSPDTDAICSSIVMAEIQKKLTGKDVQATRLGELNPETEFVLNHFNVEFPTIIEGVEEGQEVMLVDHNEFVQSANGIEKAKILAVVDHHKIANFQTSEPLFYYAQPVGCTSTILFEMCKSNNIEVTKTMAGLMLSAIISDTLLLKSPTCTAKDVLSVKELAQIVGIDYNEYGLEMLKAGTKLDSYSEKELLYLDAKKSEKDGIKYMVAQVNTVSIEDVLLRKEKIEEAMKEAIEEHDLKVCLFVITDIINSNSKGIVLGERTDIITKSFEVSNDIVDMPGVVSRKKQIMPVIENNF